MSLGERFRAAREQRGETLSEVAEHLRIRSVYLAAIEEENWSAIGAPVYTRGFLRTYARYLNLDPEQAVAEYNAAAGPVASPPSAPAVQTIGVRTDSPRSLKWLLWGAGALALALVGFVVYLFVTPPGAPRSQVGLNAAAPSSPTGSGSPAASPSASPATAHTLLLVFTAPSWLRVIVDGNVSIEGTFPAGTRKAFHGSSATVRIGNAGGVEVTVDGRSVGTLGASGDVVEKTFVL